MKIIEVRGLSKNFGNIKAVDNISFDVEEGECFGLLGPNGAGKTTTLKILATVLNPDSVLRRYVDTVFSKTRTR